MRRLGLPVVLVAVALSGCDGGQRVLPTGPTALSAVPPASPAAPVSQPTIGTQIGVGEVVISRVTAEDPLCDPAWPYRCRYFRVTAAHSGSVEVTMTWSPQVVDPYPLDISVIDPHGAMWSAQVGPGSRRSVRFPCVAGATYVIEVWSAEAPGEPFELRSSLVPA